MELFYGSGRAPILFVFSSISFEPLILQIIQSMFWKSQTKLYRSTFMQKVRFCTFGGSKMRKMMRFHFFLDFSIHKFYVVKSGRLCTTTKSNLIFLYYRKVFLQKMKENWTSVLRFGVIGKKI